MKSKVYVVTGATSGIGKAVVEVLAKYSIVFAGYRSEEKAKELIIMGFIDRFREELPMEYAVELNNLLKNYF